MSFSDGQLLASFGGWGQQYDDVVIATIDGDLSAGEVLGAVSVGNSLGFDQSWGTWLSSSAGVLYGTPGDDNIQGGDSDQVIYTLGGDDTVVGGGGHDIVVMEGSAGSLSYAMTPGRSGYRRNRGHDRQCAGIRHWCRRVHYRRQGLLAGW